MDCCMGKEQESAFIKQESIIISVKEDLLTVFKLKALLKEIKIAIKTWT